MLKQFHLVKKCFADPVLRVDDKGEMHATTSGEGWYSIHTQAEIDGICASITGEGEVWAENGTLFYSGKKPDNDHDWDTQTKQWKKLSPQQRQAQQRAQLTEEKQEVIRKLADQADEIKNRILVGYPQAEIDSFYRQEREARGWLEDNTLPTPMLSAIAESRDIPLDILVQKVIKKADKLAEIMGQIIGTRQAFESRIQHAKNLDELTACEQEIAQWQQPNR